MEHFHKPPLAEQRSSPCDAGQSKPVPNSISRDFHPPDERFISEGSPPGTRYGRRNRKVEKRATKLVEYISARCLDPDGVVDHEEVVDTLRRSLELVDPEYKKAMQAAQLVGAMRRGLARQGHDKLSRGVKRAVTDLALSGCSSATYSVGSACAMIGVSHRGKRGREEEKRSTAESFSKPRKKHRQAFDASVKAAVREFALCYCKFEEKTYVSVLSIHAVWLIYCKFHDREGNFFPMGK